MRKIQRATAILKWALDNKTTIKEAQKKFGVFDGYVRDARKQHKNKNTQEAKEFMALYDKFNEPKVYQTPMPIDQELAERQRQAIIKEHKKRNEQLLQRLEELNDAYDQLLALRQISNVTPAIIKADTSIKSQAVPIIQFSDWHVEENIESSVTGGLNKYNPDIAQARSRRLSENTIKLIRKERQDVTIKQLVICLGGDFINNYLHDHDVQTNFMSPLEAVMFAKGLLKETLLTIAENADVDKIVLLCIRGNHGRLTKRMQSSNDYKMNWEAMLYNTLKQELNTDQFEWHIPESELGYVQVFSKGIRAFHGHQVNYQGGVGDITVPVNKVIQKWDRTVKADHNLMHHYHSYWMPTRNTSLNGSLCGWNSYALSIGAPYEPPMQVFHLLDSKRGFTTRMPILCE